MSDTPKTQTPPETQVLAEGKWLRLLKRGQLATLFNRHHMERYYPSVANQ